MNTEELLKSLETFEQNLAQVDSARKEVEKTVQAYQALQQQVDQFLHAFDGVQASFNAMVAEMKNNKSVFAQDAEQVLSASLNKMESEVSTLEGKTKTIVSDYETACELARNHFVDASNESLKLFTEKINDFSMSVETVQTSLQSTTVRLSQVSAALPQSISDSFSSISNNIDKILQNSSNLKHDVNNICGSVTQAVNLAKQEIIDKETVSITNAVSSIHAKTENLQKDFEEWKGSILQNTSDLQHSVNNICGPVSQAVNLAKQEIIDKETVSITNAVLSIRAESENLQKDFEEWKGTFTEGFNGFRKEIIDIKSSIDEIEIEQQSQSASLKLMKILMFVLVTINCLTLVLTIL